MSGDIPPVYPMPSARVVRDRAAHLRDTDHWNDDEDILDAGDRIEARQRTADAPGTLTPAQAEVVLNTPPQRRWINPYESLLDELRRTVAYIVMLEMSVREHDKQGGAHRTTAGRSVLARYERERDRHVKIAETCIRLGIAERTVKLAEREAEEVVRLVVTASSRAGLTADQRRALMSEIAAGIRAEKTARIVEARAVSG